MSSDHFGASGIEEVLLVVMFLECCSIQGFELFIDCNKLILMSLLWVGSFGSNVEPCERKQQESNSNVFLFTGQAIRQTFAPPAQGDVFLSHCSAVLITLQLKHGELKHTLIDASVRGLLTCQTAVPYLGQEWSLLDIQCKYKQLGRGQRAEKTWSRAEVTLHWWRSLDGTN